MKHFASQPISKQMQGSRIWSESPGIGEQILEQVKSLKNWQDNLNLAFKQLQESPGVMYPIVNGLGLVKMPRWSKTDVANSIFDQLLHDLKFSAISIREGRVAEAYRKTFEWVYGAAGPESKHQHEFQRWLESNDSSLYWITGKAGSGKSTLMKHIIHDVRTRRHLEVWANGTPLIVASFYFWLAGSENLRHSQDGLLRTSIRR